MRGLKSDSLNRRLENLERQQAEPVKFELIWYDEESEPGAEIIKLRWLEEVEKEY